MKTYNGFVIVVPEDEQADHFDNMWKSDDDFVDSSVLCGQLYQDAEIDSNNLSAGDRVLFERIGAVGFKHIGQSLLAVPQKGFIASV